MSAMDEPTAIRSRTRAGLARLRGPWWMFLLTGIGMAHPRLDCPAVHPRLDPHGGRAARRLLPGGHDQRVLHRRGHAQLALAAHRDGRHLHLGQGWSFARPYDAFWALASILGLLLIFQGTFYIITSVSTREVNSTWWLGLLVGILEILLGFWASQQYRPVQGALLLIWIGFFALFRGVSEIVIAFELRHAQHP